MQEVKADTTKILNGVSDIKTDTALIPELKEEIQKLKEDFSNHQAAQPAYHGWVLQNYLNSATSYCESIASDQGMDVRVGVFQDDEVVDWPVFCLMMMTTQA
jgi:hypothetical protein